MREPETITGGGGRSRARKWVTSTKRKKEFSIGEEHHRVGSISQVLEGPAGTNKKKSTFKLKDTENKAYKSNLRK